MHQELPPIERAERTRHRIAEADHAEQFVVRRINHRNRVGSLVCRVNTIVAGHGNVRSPPRRLLGKRDGEKAKYLKPTDDLHTGSPYSLESRVSYSLLRIVPLQPKLHQLNLRLLVGDDLLRQPAHLR